VTLAGTLHARATGNGLNGSRVPNARFGVTQSISTKLVELDNILYTRWEELPQVKRLMRIGWYLESL
jgi:hypothetical protein